MAGIPDINKLRRKDLVRSGFLGFSSQDREAHRAEQPRQASEQGLPPATYCSNQLRRLHLHLLLSVYPSMTTDKAKAFMTRSL
jgi:hypothetical protein